MPQQRAWPTVVTILVVGLMIALPFYRVPPETPAGDGDGRLITQLPLRASSPVSGEQGQMLEDADAAGANVYRPAGMAPLPARPSATASPQPEPPPRDEFDAKFPAPPRLSRQFPQPAQRHDPYAATQAAPAPGPPTITTSGRPARSPSRGPRTSGGLAGPQRRSASYQPPVPRFAAQPQPDAAAPAAPATPPAMRLYTLRDGDTLESLAARYLGDSAQAHLLYQLNRDVLWSPQLLPLGKQIRIPRKDALSPL